MSNGTGGGLGWFSLPLQIGLGIALATLFARLLAMID